MLASRASRQSVLAVLIVGGLSVYLTYADAWDTSAVVFVVASAGVAMLPTLAPRGAAFRVAQGVVATLLTVLAVATAIYGVGFVLAPAVLFAWVLVFAAPRRA